MFSRRLPVATLADHCRGLRYYLEAGLTLSQAMKNQAKKGPRLIRPAAGRMASQLERGEDLATVLAEERDLFPPLYLTLANVAEETGKLPEALRELEEYFRLQHQLWRQFVSQITWPAFQFVMAVLVMAGLIYILGEWLPSNNITVFGLQGSSGALIFLSVIGGGIVLLLGGYWFATEVIRAGGPIDRLLLAIPYVGGCLQALALCRFSMAMSIMVEAGTRVPQAAKLALDATGNYAFADRGKPTQTAMKGGMSLTEALAEQQIFPSDYLDMVATAEEGGREPDVFERLAKQYHEIATDRMTIMTKAAGWLVWLMVALFIIMLLVNLWGQYFSAIDSLGI